MAVSTVAVAVAVAAAGCGTGPGDAEREFVAAMLPHHRLGTRLVDEASMNSSDVRLRRLVFEMSGYHGHETGRLAEWAEVWEVEEAETFEGDLPTADVARLDGLSGSDHDTWWLVLMIEHHRGAVDITSRLLAGGVDPADEVAVLAGSIRSVQSDELAVMDELLAELCTEDPSAAGC